MRGNTFGKLFSITTFGESHGKSIGVILDGVPSQLEFSQEDLQNALDKRAPGRLKGVTSRKEGDKAIVQSGIFEQKTLGTPICIIINNTNQKSADYNKLKTDYRAGHADLTTIQKFGIRDHRGGGRASGRETIARVIGGYFAELILNSDGDVENQNKNKTKTKTKVKVKSFVNILGKFENKKEMTCISDLELNDYAYPSISENVEIEKYLIDLKKNGNSVGGQIITFVENCPIGLGEPCFDKLKADFAKAIISIGGCVSFSFGYGEKMARLSGNTICSDKKAFGGIEGGMSNGEQIVLNCTFKPTSTVGDKAKSGRHDPCILPRAVYVVEAMVKIVLADHLLRQRAYKK